MKQVEGWMEKLTRWVVAAGRLALEMEKVGKGVLQSQAVTRVEKQKEKRCLHTQHLVKSRFSGR